MPPPENNMRPEWLFPFFPILIFSTLVTVEAGIKFTVLSEYHIWFCVPSHYLRKCLPKYQFCSRQRVAVPRHRIICLVYVKIITQWYISEFQFCSSLSTSSKWTWIYYAINLKITRTNGTSNEYWSTASSVWLKTWLGNMSL